MNSIQRANIAVLRAVALGVVVHVGAIAASEIRFEPQPAVAGQTVTVTYVSEAFACDDQGILSVHQSGGGSIELYVTPPGCPVIPISFERYTASTTIGPLASGRYTIRVFDSSSHVLLDRRDLEVKSAPVCAVSGTSLCLLGRLDVRGSWEDFAGHVGPAHALGDDLQGLGAHGLLWFFSADNPEILVKVVDGCSVNDRYWVFVSPGSTVAYDITVRDVITGTARTYRNAKGVSSPLVADTQTFVCH